MPLAWPVVLSSRDVAGDEDEEEHWGEYTALCDSGAEFDLGPRSLWGWEVDACVFVE
jgi:hypothetical protein